MRSRVSKITYGVFADRPYDPSDPDHESRSHDVYIDVSGEKWIPQCFDIILPKVSCLIPFFQKHVIKKEFVE